MARILIVDDEPDIVEAVKMRLENYGYDIIKAINGLEAIEKSKTEKPDLIILDVMMPGLDGFEVCRRIRHDPETSSIPIIFLTVAGGAEHRQRGLQAGAQVYIAKPFESEILVDEVKKLLKEQ